jgi:membrane-associated phospholipid phosphatase
VASMKGRKARRSGRLLGCAVGFVVLAAPRVVLAQELRASQATDLAVTLGGAGAWLTSDELQEQLTAPHCRWCDRTSGTDTLNDLDRAVRALRWRRTSWAATLSDVALLATPIAAEASSAFAAGRGGGSHDLGTDTLVVAETGVLAADLNQLVKFLALRERPDAHAVALVDPKARRASVDDDLSFCSGHTTETVALAVAAGTVSSLHGYRFAPLVWSTSLPLAAVTGYLRIAADRHYLTDVLAGAVLGAAVGFLVPYAIHRPDGPTQGSAGTAQGYSLGVSGSF